MGNDELFKLTNEKYCWIIHVLSVVFSRVIAVSGLKLFFWPSCERFLVVGSLMLWL
jgi:hypothetical protein